MPINSESTPPPLIGKIGPYTVFMTPPATPSPVSQPQPVFESPKKVIQPPPVQPPPHQFDKSVSVAASPNGNASVSGFFRNAVSKVQNGNSYDAMSCSAKWFSALSSFFEFNAGILGLQETDARLGFYFSVFSDSGREKSIWGNWWVRKLWNSMILFCVAIQGVQHCFSPIDWCVIRPGFLWNSHIFSYSFFLCCHYY